MKTFIKEKFKKSDANEYTNMAANITEYHIISNIKINFP